MWSIDDWQPGDFAPSPLTRGSLPPDPWQPDQAQPSSAPPDAQDLKLAIWLDELAVPTRPRQSARLPARVPDPLERLYQSREFEPLARQRLWPAERSVDRQDSHARRKAASLVLGLGIFDPRQRAAALSFLTELLQDFPHSMTYRALAREITGGANLDAVRAMAELKRLWSATPTWWVRRRYCQMQRQQGFVRDRHGVHALSWRLARRLSEARWR